MAIPHRVSVEEFEAMPLEGKWELIDGEVIELTRSAAYAAWVGGNIFGHLHDYVESGKYGWAFMANTGFVLFPNRAIVRSPNAAFVSYDRLPVITDHFVAAAPNIAAEVPSPWDNMSYMVSKVAMYLETGVQLVWLVDTVERTVVVFRLDRFPMTLSEVDVLDGGDVLPGFNIPIAEIFT